MVTLRQSCLARRAVLDLLTHRRTVPSVCVISPARVVIDTLHYITQTHTHTPCWLHWHGHNTDTGYARVFFLLLFSIVNQKSGAVTTQAYARVFFLLLFSRGPISTMV